MSSAGTSSTTYATLTTWQWDSGAWHEVLASMPARIGTAGWTSDPHESDGATPAGDFAIEYGFGTAPAPGGNLPWRAAGPNDHWVDDPASPFYNTWQTGEPDGRWASAENLANYSHAIVFDFNEHPVVPGGNSAIFLHAGSDEPSAGCIMVSDADMVRLLRWLDLARAPRLIAGPAVSHP